MASGCDVHSHLYSFSFNLNPNWSKQLAEQAEILQYIEDTVDKFDLRKHIHASVECLGAHWDSANNEWSLRFRDLMTEIVFTRTATMLISAVGGISVPRDVRLPHPEEPSIPYNADCGSDRSISKAWKVSKGPSSTPRDGTILSPTRIRRSFVVPCPF
jgi:hypothetical protein